MLFYCYQCQIFYAIQFYTENEIQTKCPRCDGRVTQKIFISEIILDDEKVAISSLFEKEKGMNEEKRLCDLLVSGKCKYPHTRRINVKLKNE